MKQRILVAGLLAATLSLPFTGCAAQAGAIQDGTASDPASGYQQQISALEQALLEEREAHYITKATLSAEIEALQERLALLATGKEEGEVQETVELSYRVEHGKAVITGYRGEAAILNLPSELDGYPVGAIGERAFEGAALTAVVLPQGVESIGWFAFYGCKDLISVSLPESVSLIGYAVFDGCTRVTLFCQTDSYAQRYAQSYGIPCVCR